MKVLSDFFFLQMTYNCMERVRQSQSQTKNKRLRIAISLEMYAKFHVDIDSGSKFLPKKGRDTLDSPLPGGQRLSNA